MTFTYRSVKGELLTAAEVDANFQEVETKYDGTVAAKEAAESARDKAGEWAENPEDVEVETGQFSAKHHASKASTSKTAAETARDKAGEWAENPEDVEVETGKYSALHHALKAAQSAIDAAAAVTGHTQNTDTSLDLGGENPVTAAELVVLKDTTVPLIESNLSARNQSSATNR